jgi:glucose-1-phosphate cytidylyltransferase
MKVVILSGGFGTRLSEETTMIPKPMVEIGGKPILLHIMNIYSAYGINEFIIAVGYKAEVIKEYFLNFYALNNDITVDLTNGKTIIHGGNKLKWKIHIVDTGLYTQTGGRLKRLKGWLEKEEVFMVTYGDGVADIDINALLKFHKSHGKLATVTTVHVPERFGRIAFEGNQITEFYEKPAHVEGWINGGYFVLNSKAFDYIDNDETIWERSPMERLASNGQLFGYRHSGFWSCMDTLKEKNFLEELWNSGKAPWKVW